MKQTTVTTLWSLSLFLSLPPSPYLPRSLSQRERPTSWWWTGTVGTGNIWRELGPGCHLQLKKYVPITFISPIAGRPGITSGGGGLTALFCCGLPQPGNAVGCRMEAVGLPRLCSSATFWGLTLRGLRLMDWGLTLRGLGLKESHAEGLGSHAKGVSCWRPGVSP